MPEYQVGILEEAELTKWWPEIENILDTHPPPGTWLHAMGSAGIKQMADDGDLHIWGAGDTTEFQLLLITRVVEYPHAKILRIEYAYGKNLDDLISHLDSMMSLCAKAYNCDQITFVGREGWKKKLIPYGFSVTGIVMSKPVVNERIH